MNAHQESYSDRKDERERLEKELDRLRHSLMIKRQTISECSQDLIDYCLSNAQNDAFLAKIPSSKNPFRETGGITLKNCTLL